MSSILDALTSQLGGSALSQISRQIGSDDGATSGAIAAALPMILGGLIKNAGSSGGASALGAALDKDHDGSLLDDIGGFLGNQKVQESQGGGILGHIFASQGGGVANAVSKSSGLNSGATKQLMMILAPMVMAQLGRQKRKSGLDTGGLSDLLRGERRQIEAKPNMGMFAKMLDRDGDGSAFDDVAKAGVGMLGSFLRRRR